MGFCVIVPVGFCSSAQPGTTRAAARRSSSRLVIVPPFYHAAGARILRRLNLSRRESEDLVVFLQSLTDSSQLK